MIVSDLPESCTVYHDRDVVRVFCPSQEVEEIVAKALKAGYTQRPHLQANNEDGGNFVTPDR